MTRSNRQALLIAPIIAGLVAGFDSPKNHGLMMRIAEGLLAGAICVIVIYYLRFHKQHKL